MSVKKRTGGSCRERRSAWLLARRDALPFPVRISAREREGSFEGALEALGILPSEAERIRAERSLARIEEKGYRVLSLGDPDYPPLLASIVDPPLVLTFMGTIRREDALAISVVGSRRATPYGREIARRLARDLAATGLTIVSGLARGIDAAAHEGALEAQGRTLAVLGSGLDELYPREHRRLAERIAAKGAVLSELDLDEPPHARNFPRRNRIITGLSLGTLVVEAAEKSGSLISARLALEQNREVFAVPGPVSSRVSEGVHALLRDGARLVTRAEDVLDELRPEIRGALVERPRSSPVATGDLDPEERQVASLLEAAHEALDVDRILERLPLPIERTLAALCRLEVKNVVESLPGGLYRARAP